MLSYLICCEGPPGDLPEDEAECVHVRRLEALEGGGDERLVQHLGGHVPPRSHSAHVARVKAGLRIRIGSEINRVSGSGSGFRIRIGKLQFLIIKNLNFL
jgi:hypothetical protein